MYLKNREHRYAIEWTTNFICYQAKWRLESKAFLPFLAPRSYKMWCKKLYYSCLMPYFSFAIEVSFLGKCSLHKSDAIKGASPNFLLVFAKALWIPLSAKNIATLRCLAPSSQQIDPLNHVLCLVFVLETDHHGTKKHCVGYAERNSAGLTWAVRGRGLSLWKWINSLYFWAFYSRS